MKGSLRIVAWCTAGLLWALLTACQRPQTVAFHDADAYPEQLSGWGVIRKHNGALALGEGVVAYDINTPLFTDYALKLRTVYLPPGQHAVYDENDSFEFPVGTIISKTFFYPVEGGVLQPVSSWDGDPASIDLDRYEIIETRLLVRQAHGWDALPYVWHGDDAYLSITGALEPRQIALPEGVRSFPYVVPTRNECAGCHATNHSSGSLMPIGPKARHLNRPYAGRGENQLTAWSRRGLLEGAPPAQSAPREALWNDPQQPLEARARAYLDSNCGHCHNPHGAADTSGLWLDAQTVAFRPRGFCKPPIAAGRGTGGRSYSVVPGRPDASILLFRMQTDDPGSRMPEAGRSLVHREGVQLIRDWIQSLDGDCV
ncbi:MAG: SO2930 family diheme c-type cytochrome [Pseudomonadales bacterium]